MYMPAPYQTIDEIRRANLEMVIEREYGGVSLRLAEAMGIPQTQITRCTSNAASRRNVGDKLARDIERAAGLPVGWMDCVHDEMDDVYDILNGLPSDRRQLAGDLIRAMVKK